jgi:Hemerythrin HHE cation binding domain/Four helix bundle sensory module for signal transduction
MIKEMLGVAEGILQDIHNDHHEIYALISRIEGTNENPQRHQFFEEMRAKLLGHDHAEQDVLYHRLTASQNDASRSIAHEGTNEHQLIEQQLQKMSTASTKMSEEWTAELKVLREMADHHFREEESTGFRCARRDLDKEELERMSGEFQLLKAHYMMQVA